MIEESDEIQEIDVPETFDEASDGEALENEAVEEQQSEIETDVSAIDPQTLEREKALARYEGMIEAQKNAQSQPVTAALPEIPNQPSDPFDENYEKDMIAYARAVAAHEFAKEQHSRDAEKIEREKYESQYKQAVNYTDSAIKAGVTQEQLGVAAKTIAAYGGVSDDIAATILSSKNGHEITLALAENPKHVNALAAMNPVEAGIYLAGLRKPVPSQKKSNTPKPVQSVSGAAPSAKHPLLKNVSYS